MSHGTVFNIQRYSTQDGPGLRTTVFMKGCPLACRWCHNPESQSRTTQFLRMENRCMACGRCTPEEVSGQVARDLDGEDLEACPTGAVQQVGEALEPVELVARLLRDRIFFDDSGGGVTFSGGEPLMQPGFLLETLERLRAEGVHTALDTRLRPLGRPAGGGRHQGIPAHRRQERRDRHRPRLLREQRPPCATTGSASAACSSAPASSSQAARPSSGSGSTVRHALDPQRRRRHHRPALPRSQQPMGSRLQHPGHSDTHSLTRRPLKLPASHHNIDAHPGGAGARAGASDDAGYARDGLAVAGRYRRELWPARVPLAGLA